MTDLIDNAAGGYRFLPGNRAFSGGVMPDAGHTIAHATLRAPLPYAQGFALIERHLAGLGRPFAALCAVELRVPQPLSFASFAEFNRGYIQLLADSGLQVEGLGPMARTNVAPAVWQLAEPSLYAFSYTVPHAEAAAAFVLAGAGDLAPGSAGPEGVVRQGETTPDALREKIAFTVGELDKAARNLGVAWRSATRVNLYTAHPVESFLADLILAEVPGAATHGLHWFYSRPPIADMQVEIDARSVSEETYI
jgi:hypothetical protein